MRALRMIWTRARIFAAAGEARWNGTYVAGPGDVDTVDTKVRGADSHVTFYHGTCALIKRLRISYVLRAQGNPGPATAFAASYRSRRRGTRRRA